MKLEQINSHLWRIPKSSMNGMRVDGNVFASRELLAAQDKDQSPQQVANVATLPGIIGASLAMPDMHWGYGFPIGGVAAFDKVEGVISPGGVGYDINCGVNLTRTSLTDKDILPKLNQLINRMFDTIPAGLGRGGGVRVTQKEFDQVITRGAKWARDRELASDSDVEHMEENGCMSGANPDCASQRCRERGFDQIGTLSAPAIILSSCKSSRKFSMSRLRKRLAYSCIKSASWCTPARAVSAIKSAPSRFP